MNEDKTQLLKNVSEDQISDQMFLSKKNQNSDDLQELFDNIESEVRSDEQNQIKIEKSKFYNNSIDKEEIN